MAFSNQEDYKFSLFEGPWMVADHYLILQRWRPFFLMNGKITKKVALWIRIQRLSIELYSNIFLHMIGISLGKFLKVDKLTSIQSKGKFVRICVKLDLEKPLETHIYVHGLSMKVFTLYVFVVEE